MTEKMNDVIIRIASVADAPEIREIYAPYVEKTAITFEYKVPSIEEFKGRIKAYRCLPGSRKRILKLDPALCFLESGYH